MARDWVRQRLREFETEHDVDVLIAGDFGSRAWNLASERSDRDVAFVFRQDPISYVEIDGYRRSIDRRIEYEGADHTFAGWNLKRFANLLRGSNPTAIEFLNSGVRYVEGRDHWRELTEYVNENFKPIAMMGHYRSLARKNYEEYLEPGTDVSLKRNLYTVRALLYRKWVAETHRVPPLDFVDFVESRVGELDGGNDPDVDPVVATARRWARAKKGGRGRDAVGNPLREWIERELENGLDPESHDVRGIEKEVLNRHVRRSFEDVSDGGGRE